MEDNKIKTDDMDFGIRRCPICEEIKRTDNVCLDCLQRYLKPVKDFMSKYPGATYMEMCWNPELPVTKKIFYHLEKARLIKFK